MPGHQPSLSTEDEMANITFNNPTTGFSMWFDEVMPNAVNRAVDHFYFSTINRYQVFMEGGPFAYDSNGLPIAGDVEQISVLFPGTNGTSAPDLAITDLHVGISAYASLLGNGTAAHKTMAFWTATLSGNDTIDFGTNATQAGFNINFAGDGNAAPGEAVGADDVLNGDIGGGVAVGDYFLVKANQAAFGGDDEIRLDDSLGAYVMGDFYTGEVNSKQFAGDDFIQLGQQAATVYGDVAYLHGTLAAGDDTILGGAGADVLFGDVGYAYATATFKSGNDEIHGGAGGDTIYGDAGYALDATFVGGHDRLYGDTGSDTIFGNAGNDFLDGGGDDDFLQSGDGNDVLRGGTGQDSIYGGDGVDTADYRDRLQKVEITLNVNGGGTVKVNGVAEDALGDIENIIGGAAGDKIKGDATYGDNVFDGRGGNDTLSGNDGRDTVIGGQGKDKLIGGADADQFVFNARLGSTNIDKIVDFGHGVDEIALDDAIFKALGTSFEKNEFVARADGHAATKASQHVIYDKSDGTLWYDVDGSGGKAAVQFAQLGSVANHPMNLGWDDFAIV
jgi:Ca2+-binding RTX toxin-like protein